MAAILTVLNEIVSSERFEPVETENLEARYTRPGQLTIITMHKAKGWIGTMFSAVLHENVIPGSFWVPPQTKFLGDLLAEARAQIRAALHDQSPYPALQRQGTGKTPKTAEEFRPLCSHDTGKASAVDVCCPKLLPGVRKLGR